MGLGESGGVIAHQTTKSPIGRLIIDEEVTTVLDTLRDAILHILEYLL